MAQRQQKKGPARNLRVVYNAERIKVCITNPGGNNVCYSAIPRNLSRHGIAFLHGQFVYPNSQCGVTLKTLDGEIVSMVGTIIRCNHLGGTIHEVAAKFNSPIDLTHFARLTPEEAHSHGIEYQHDVESGRIDRGPKALGRVLVVDAYKLDRLLFTTMLDQAGYSSTGVATAEEALGCVQGGHFDLAIVDVCRDQASGTGQIKRLRDKGFGGAIIAVSAEDKDTLEQEALASGADVLLPKPITGESLISSAKALLGRDSGSRNGTNEIVSTLSGDQALQPLLQAFIDDARSAVAGLRSALDESDEQSLLRICRQLKGSGGSYGFEAITSSAELVLQSLGGAEKDIGRQRASVDNLIKVIDRIRAT
jgi:CheY-like chemotaxis protein